MDNELEQKMATIRATTDAIARAKEALWEKPSYSRAVAVRNLEKQRDELRATLPKLRLVA